MTVLIGHHSLAEQVAATIRRHREGDADAFGELFRLATPWLSRIALACRLSPYSADDVVQATMESALAHLPRLRDPDAGLAWLSVIAKREAIRVSREERRVDLLGADDELAEGFDGADPERIALANVARESLMLALAKLPDRHRRLLSLLFLEDRVDYARIASELGMPIGSIGPTRQRTLRKVRALLSADEGSHCARCA